MRNFTLLFVCCFIFKTNAQVNFQESIIIDNSNAVIYPQSLYSVDIDGDNDIDLLSTSWHKISWYENLDGMGNYSIQKVITTDVNSPRDVYAADIDGDGDIDVLSASAGDDKIAWYENIDGQGNFGPQQIVWNADGAYSIYASDIDGDGDMDILSAATNDANVAWYENIDGQGNFGIQQTIGSGKTSVCTADIDGDGDMDVISASTNLGFQWFENIDGLGSFGEAIDIYSFGEYANSVRSTDIDGDGDMDVLSASLSLTNIGYLQWNENLDGNGTFGLPVLIDESLQKIDDIAVSDNDGDGDMDISLVKDYTAIWYENLNGQGNFSLHEIDSSGNFPISIHINDYDSDGDLDTAYGSNHDRGIYWQENMDGQGNFGDSHSIIFYVPEVTSVFSSDLNGDGNTDIISTSFGDNKIAWYENIDGEGNFSDQKIINTNLTRIRLALTSDFDDDGDMDIICSSFSKVWLIENMDGLGNFGSPEIVSNTHGANSLFTADVDGDEDIDLLFADGNSNLVAWYENTTGLGSFDVLHTISTNLNYPTSIYATDIDNDNDIDIIYSSSTNLLAWNENIDGLGNFNQEHLIATDVYGIRNIFGLDIDMDNDIDILTGSDGDDKIVWYENIDGQGFFGTENIIADNLEQLNDIHPADIDGDSYIDIISSFSGGGKLTYYKNLDGVSGDFGNEVIIATNTFEFISLHAIDMDNDNDIDIISGNSESLNSRIIFYKNLSIPISVPENIIISCDQDETNLEITGNVICDIPCSLDDYEVSYSDIVTSGDCINEKIIMRIWTFTDMNGNSETDTQTIQIIDSINPTIEIEPSNLIVMCGSNDNAIQDWLETNGGAYAYDNCSDIVWTYEINDNGSNCSQYVEVLFTVSDACGNSAITSANYSYIGYNELNFYISPNPVLDSFEIISSSDISELNVYDLQGKLVFTFNGQTRINVYNLSSGIYLLKGKDFYGNSKIIKMIKK